MTEIYHAKKKVILKRFDMWSLSEMDAASDIHFIGARTVALQWSLRSSQLPLPHTDTTHTTKRVGQSASLKVTPTKNWRSLDISQELGRAEN